MAMQRRRAAQYVRMSTDMQELSPIIQKEAIAAYAAANALDIVASYEDEAEAASTSRTGPGCGSSCGT